MKITNLAYEETFVEEMPEKMTVIQIHNNEYLQKERVMLEYPVVLKDKPAYNKLKRIGDVIGSVGALVVLSPVFLATTLAILIDDFGNPFYSQVRIGKNGKPFEIYKFRSMYKNADQRREELLRKNESKGANFKIKNDPRITRVGAILRKTSIEPQLVNILKGDMSFVGPRPFIPAEQKNLAPDRLLVKPGLSCYWQIGGKNELSEAEQIALDRKYIQERSIKTDIKIIFKTILHVLSGKNC